MNFSVKKIKNSKNQQKRIATWRKEHQVIRSHECEVCADRISEGVKRRLGIPFLGGPEDWAQAPAYDKPAFYLCAATRSTEFRSLCLTWVSVSQILGHREHCPCVCQAAWDTVYIVQVYAKPLGTQYTLYVKTQAIHMNRFTRGIGPRKHGGASIKVNSQIENTGARPWCHVLRPVSFSCKVLLTGRTWVFTWVTYV